jgi:hypothetical protein
MNTLNNNTLQEIYFNVGKKHINNNKALLPNVLYQEMEHFVNCIISNYKDLVLPTPQLFKLQILKNAYLNDKLTLSANIKRLDELELHLWVEVNNQQKTDNPICKAIFKFQLLEKISKAS